MITQMSTNEKEPEPFISTILAEARKGNGATWFSVNGAHQVWGKYDAGTIHWNAEPEHCTRLLPDDVFLYSDGSFYRVYTPRPGHLSMWKLTAAEVDPDGAAMLEDYDSVTADQAAILGRV